MPYYYTFWILLLASFFACSPQRTNQQSNSVKENAAKNHIVKKIDLQGHRGCRGLYPENSIEGFIHALQLGVNTLEMDVVITKDQKVVLSHEPWMSHHIALDPAGNKIPKSKEQSFNLFEMTLEEIQQFDCGSLFYPLYPQQQKIKTYKPSLAEVIDTVEAYIKANDLPPVYYNIETKSTVERTGIYHPEPKTFVALLMGVIEEKNIGSQCIIQSFDIRTLQEMHQSFPKIQTALLIESNKDYKAALAELAYQPEIYSPHHKLVNADLVAYLKQQNIRLIPWTINNKKRMQDLIDLGVDGIITDYPDRALEILKR